MNRNMRMMIYLVFAAIVIFVMMDCARRMQQRRAQPQAAKETPSQ